MAFVRPSLKKIGRARAFVRYFRDPQASVLGKLFVLAAVAYVIWPMDLIPDVPIIGWLDDLGVASLAMGWVWKVVGRYREASETPDGSDLRAAVKPLPSS
jgi:uncharacterized membrane protein YkvA (DUF1232 family)